MFSSPMDWCVSWLCLCMGAVLLLRHSKAGSAVCTLCDSPVAWLLAAGQAGSPQSVSCQQAATPGCAAAALRELWCQRQGPQQPYGHTWGGNSGLWVAKAPSSALKQRIWVLCEAQPPKGDVITLLRRSGFPSGIGKSYKCLHKPKCNPYSGESYWLQAKLHC